MEYRSTIKSILYIYIGIKKSASYILQGFNDFQIKEIAIKENIFQINSEAWKKEIASMMFKRLKVLDEILLDKLVNGDLKSRKLTIEYNKT